MKRIQKGIERNEKEENRRGMEIGGKTRGDARVTRCHS